MIALNLAETESIVLLTVVVAKTMKNVLVGILLHLQMGFGEHGDLGLYALHHALVELEQEQEHVTTLRQPMEAAIALEMHNNKDNVTPKHARHPSSMVCGVLGVLGANAMLNARTKRDKEFVEDSAMIHRHLQGAKTVRVV